MQRIVSLLILLVAVVLAGCGGGGGGGGGSITPPDPPSGTVEVSILPQVITLVAGDSCTFAASVTGSTNTAVLWTVVEEIDGGLIDTAGHYTAPSTAGTCHVRATSSADPTKYAVAVITVTDDSTPPPGVSVRVSPSEVTVPPGESMVFTATVSGTANTAVTWSVLEADGGSITGAGIYTAPNTEMVAHVRATSVADPTKVATATVTVVDLPPIPLPP